MKVRRRGRKFYRGKNGENPRWAHVWPFRAIRSLGLSLAVMLLATHCAWCIDDVVPQQALEHVQFCAEYLARGELVHAEARCKLAQEYSPRYAEPWNLLGLIEHRRGHRDAARELFKAALSRRNDFAEAHNNLGAILLEEKDYSFACDQFAAALEVDPGYIEARRNLGMCYYHSEKPTKARNEFLKCLELDPVACDCRWGLGVLAADGEDYKQARVHFQRMTEVCREQATGYYNLCWVQYKLGRCVEAVDACMGAISLDPEYLEAKQNLATAYECLALESGVVQSYLDRIRKTPGDPELHFSLATVLEEQRLYEQALGEYLNVLKLDERNKLAHYRAARILDDQMRGDEALELCKNFVELVGVRELREERRWCVALIQELQYQ